MSGTVLGAEHKRNRQKNPPAAYMPVGREVIKKTVFWRLTHFIEKNRIVNRNEECQRWRAVILNLRV